MKLTWISIFFALLAGCSSTTPISAPDLKYQPPGKQEAEQLAKGLRYHDSKLYAQAIREYHAILEKNPANAMVMYELAFTYFSQQEFVNSLKYATEAAKYNSPFLANVYLLVGLNHEKLGNIKQALRVYEYANTQFKDHQDLQYRLASAYLAADQPEQAAETFKKIITRYPYHTESHLQLGLAYYEHDYKTPAFLSLITFLLLEPDSERAQIVVGLLDDIFKSGIDSDEKSGMPSLAVNLESKTDEGDFRLVDISMSSRRIALMTAKEQLSEMDIKLAQLDSVLLILSQFDTQKNTGFFILRQYQPFYKQLYQRKLTAALLHFTHQSLNEKETLSWLAMNRKQIDELKAAFKYFTWAAN